MSGSVETLSKSSAMLMRHASASRSNTRIPPIARRSSSPMPCRMALMSRNKLQKETNAKSPDLRRCLGHQRLLRRSIEVAQEDARKAMAACQLDDSDSDSDDEYGYVDDSPVSPIREQVPVSPIREQISSVMKAMVKRRTSQSRVPENNVPVKEPVKIVRIASKSESIRDMPPLEPATNDLTLRKTASSTSISTRGRRYASKLNFGRRFWSPSAVQTIAT